MGVLTVNAKTAEFYEGRVLPTDSCKIFFFSVLSFLGSRMRALREGFLQLSWIFNLCIPFRDGIGHFQSHKESRDTFI